MAVTRAEIDAADARIAPYIRRTPVLQLDETTWLKLELLQHSGSFKVRGAFNRMLAIPVPAAGVVAASGGNAGLAVAHAAGVLGVPAEIFVPEGAPVTKVDRLRASGAEVRLVGASYGEALTAADARVTETGALSVHAYDQPEIVAGQGTLGRELEDQVPGMTTVLVAVGGGGLISGVASFLGDSVRVVALETQACPTLHRALKAGRPIDVEVGGVAADSLGARRIGAIAWAARDRIAETFLVPDEVVHAARADLWSRCRVAAEPGAAVAWAALLHGIYTPSPHERVVVIVCGGNADPGDLSR